MHEKTVAHQLAACMTEHTKRNTNKAQTLTADIYCTGAGVWVVPAAKLSYAGTERACITKCHALGAITQQQPPSPAAT